MSWRVAQAWVDAVFLYQQSFLGVWRAQHGPGPWSIYLLRPDGGILEIWAAPGGALYGKKLATGAPS